MPRDFTVIVERGEDGWLIGTVPELRGCSTQGRSLDDLFERVREAILLCLEDGDEEPAVVDIVGVHRIAV